MALRGNPRHGQGRASGAPETPASPVPEDGNAKYGKPDKSRAEDHHQGRIDTKDFADGHRLDPHPVHPEGRRLSAESIGKAESSERDKERADQDEDFGIHHQEFGDRHHAIPSWSSKRSPAARAVLNTPRGPSLR
jgi:hypothetical protein